MLLLWINLLCFMKFVSEFITRCVVIVNVLVHQCFDQSSSVFVYTGCLLFDYFNFYALRLCKLSTNPLVLLLLFLLVSFFKKFFSLTHTVPLAQVLVGTGSRTMKIIKIKSLKVYAFGFCKYF